MNLQRFVPVFETDGATESQCGGLAELSCLQVGVQTCAITVRLMKAKASCTIPDNGTLYVVW